jgi:hypothetical protein
MCLGGQEVGVKAVLRFIKNALDSGSLSVVHGLRLTVSRREHAQVSVTRDLSQPSHAERASNSPPWAGGRSLSTSGRSFRVTRHAVCRVKELMAAAEAGRWLEVEDLYVRPEAVVSIGLLESDAPRWKGSASRQHWGHDE